MPVTQQIYGRPPLVAPKSEQEQRSLAQSELRAPNVARMLE